MGYGGTAEATPVLDNVNDAQISQGRHSQPHQGPEGLIEVK
jgi:hypothetical protein